MQYAELHAISNFSFLRSASHPEELVTQAAALGYQAIAITDECSLAGVVKAYVAAKAHKIKLIIGSEIVLQEGIKLVLLAPDRQAYSELSALITLGRRRSEKGKYKLHLKDLQFNCRHCLAIWLPQQTQLQMLAKTESEAAHHADLNHLLSQRLWLGVELFLDAQDQQRYFSLHQLARKHELPMLACGDVQMHHKERKALLDTLTAIRLNTPLEQLGSRLHGNAERYLRPLKTLAKIYPDELLKESARIAERCHFSLNELRYEYPQEVVPTGLKRHDYLLHLVTQGAQQRWPDGVSVGIHKKMAK